MCLFCFPPFNPLVDNVRLRRFPSMLRVCLLFCFVTGFSANDCKLQAAIQQHLLNEGFHRNITTCIEFDNSLSKDMNKKCIIGLDQPLPRGVFANPDELGDFRRLQKLQATPKNRVNIELAAEESHPTGVFIFTELNDGRACVWLPVHARYHHAALGGGFVKNEIPAPFLYLRCSDRKLEKCSQSTSINFYCNADSKRVCSWRNIPVTMVTDPLNFEVPIGNTSHYYIVSVMTAGAVIAGSLFFLKTLHEYKIKEKAL